MYIVKPRADREAQLHIIADETKAQTPFRTLCGDFPIQYVDDLRKVQVDLTVICAKCLLAYNQSRQINAVVVNTNRAEVFGFTRWDEAEAFSEEMSYGAWGVVPLSSPANAKPDPIVRR